MVKYSFSKVAKAALADAERLVPQWLPGGVRSGPEWKCGNLDGDPGGSLSVNLVKGVWSDFATGESGADLIDLYAAKYTPGDKIKALRELAERLGIPPEPDDAPRRTPNSVAKTDAKPRTSWVPVLPVPDSASTPPRAHPFRGLPDALWTYKDQQARILGYVCRFTTSDGGKEIAPLVYAKNTNAKGDRYEWRWMHFSEPRPLYGLAYLGDAKPILIVEGEKCADAARTALADLYDVITWSGGSNAVHKADWSVLAQREVLIWPDTDSIMNKAKTAYLEYHDQPGLKAALKIASLLQAHSCTVNIIQIDKPGVISDGWDIFDAIAQGMDQAALLAWMRGRIVSPDSFAVSDAKDSAPAVAEKGEETPSRAGATTLYDRLLRDDRGKLEDCRENVAACLEHHPKLKGRLAFNAFTARVMRVKPVPWNDKPGEWTDNDDLELSDFLARQGPMVFKSLANVGHGVQLVAHRNKFHPLQDYLNALKWDHVDRNTVWLTDLLGVPDSDYVRLIGPLWLRQAVSRAMNPGSKADYVLILEGLQGIQKSSALRALGGDFFSDAPLDLNSKDVYQTINGVWFYEIAELDAFNRSEATRIKAFITQPIDRYRLPYEKRMIDQPRHTVFAGTTNNYEYHKDTTGNRRFWSVRCSRIDLAGLRTVRDQLFAQALHEVRAGERIYPTREEEETLIVPEQEMREIVDSWQQIIQNWLDAPINKSTRTFTTSQILMDCLGFEAARINPTRQSETKVGAIMHKLGWRKKRSSAGTRGYYYQRPDTQEAAINHKGHVP
ncbi:conjugal transfer protein TraC [Advenella kashmirensis W13003]|uniref:Conjugal transfer protein TraC n=1 Tax=Advenella kashmirensis W13003 TaxID=1424334 RepID=V8QN07_9BURK|nr:VapE domain-containing protein [Advenella kashmirensis]ETF00690.1 conjugal transfer protein TraC [Advenella kashmirensis W13003]